MTTKRLAYLLISTLIAACLASCAADPVSAVPSFTGALTVTPEQTPQPMRDTLRIPIPKGIIRLDPLHESSYKMQAALGLVFESLLTTDSAGDIAFELCDKWSFTDTGHLRLTIRQNVRFHSGRLLDAQSVVEALDSIKAAGGESPFAYIFDSIESYRADIATNEIVIQPKPGKGGYPLLYCMTFPVFDTGDLSGTGAYKPSQITGDAITLSVSGTWWMKEPDIKTVELIGLDGDDEQLSSVLLGSSDIALTRAYAINSIKSSTALKVQSLTLPDYDFLCYNLNGILSSEPMRKAIAAAIDRKELIATVYQGCAVPADMPVGSQSWLNEPEFAPGEADKAEAARRLEESGYLDYEQPPVLRFITNSDVSNRAHKDMLDRIIEKLVEIGILAEAKYYPMDQYAAKLAEGEFDVALVGASLGHAPDLTALFASNGALNFGGYSSETMDAALEEISGSSARGEYGAAVKKALRLAAADMPITGLCLRTATVIYSPDIQGMTSLSPADMYREIDRWNIAAK